MLKKHLLTVGLAVLLATTSSVPIFAETTSTTSTTTTMENCGAYLFEWRPIDCGNGNYFAILVGGNTLQESNVILNRGYDYAYTFDPMTYQRPWGTVPDLVNVDGKWGIPENWSSMPQDSQPVMQIVLKTNYKTLSTDKRYVNVVHLPSNIDSSTLPSEVRKYLINVDGSDAGAYTDTITPGWQDLEDGTVKYMKPDGTYVSNGWLQLDDKKYYMDENGVKLTDTITPDGYYVNINGEKTSYMPGWFKDGDNWRYILKNGYYAQNGWLQDPATQKYYYFNMAAIMEADTTTPDGYYVGADGAWDENASTKNTTEEKNLGPGVDKGWEPVDTGWKFKQEDGTYLTNSWRQDSNGKWYYLNEDGWMLKNANTPDGYHVDANGVWDGDAATESESEEAAE